MCVWLVGLGQSFKWNDTHQRVQSKLDWIIRRFLFQPELSQRLTRMDRLDFCALLCLLGWKRDETGCTTRQCLDSWLLSDGTFLIRCLRMDTLLPTLAASSCRVPRHEIYPKWTLLPFISTFWKTTWSTMRQARVTTFLSADFWQPKGFKVQSTYSLKSHEMLKH
jgi:hypothetical protein